MVMLKLLGDLLTAPVRGPIKGFEFILNAIQDEVDAEALDEGKVKGELMQLTLRRQAGEIDDAEYTASEDALLERLNEIRRYKEELAAEEAGAYQDEDAGEGEADVGGPAGGSVEEPA